MKVSFIDIALFVLFFQLLSIAPFFIFQRKPNNYSNQIFAVFLMAKALCISNFISFRLQEYVIIYFPHLFYVGSSFTLLWGPILYLYTKSLTHKNFKLKSLDLLHILPFFVHFIYSTFNFHLNSAETKRMLISSNSAFPPEFHLLSNIYLHVSILIYTIMAFWLIWNYQSSIKDAISSIEKVKLSWLLFVLLGFSLKWIFDVWFFISFTLLGNYIELSLVFSRIILFLFLNIMIFKVLRQPQLFSGIEDRVEGKKLSLSKSVTDQYVKKLTEYMDEYKPYLDPDITQYELAEKVNIPPRSLSEVINNSFGQNFYDFINSYRIMESQKILRNPSFHQRTVLEVLYEVGFNSKSVFNNAFKKYTGMTPSQFRQHNIQFQTSN